MKSRLHRGREMMHASLAQTSADVHAAMAPAGEEGNQSGHDRIHRA
jgi:hypothetical protein